MKSILIFFLILISGISQAEAQSRMRNSASSRRMLNTKSYGTLIRQQNPSNINSVGRIAGNEVKINQFIQDRKVYNYKEKNREYQEGDLIDYSFLEEDSGKKSFQEF